MKAAFPHRTSSWSFPFLYHRISFLFVLAKLIIDRKQRPKQKKTVSAMNGRGLGVFSAVVAVVVVAVVVVVALVGTELWNSDVIVRKRQTGHVASIGEALRVQWAGGQTEVTVKNRAGEVTNRGQLAMNSSSLGRLTTCDTRAGDICFEWERDRRLTIDRQQLTSGPDGVDCFDVTWTALECVSQVLQDCYSLQGAHWFGGFEDRDQFWPMNRIQQKMAAYVSGDAWDGQYGNIQERVFVASSGFAIYVYPEVPLFVSFNQTSDGKICLAAKYDRYPYFNPNNTLPVLRYQICQGNDVKAAHAHVLAQHVPKPKDVIAEELFRGAIWSTWAMYKGPINQTLLLQFADLIVHSGFPFHQLEVDDNWTPHYGDLDFDRTKFPDPLAMVTQAQQLGFKRVTLWVHPFMNLDSQSGQYAGKHQYLVRALDSQNPALVSWWRNPNAYLLDVTNDEAVNWYLDNLRHLQTSYNISSFKFDGGDGNYLPTSYSTHVTLNSPDAFSRLFIQMAYRADESLRAQEVRVGVRSQDIPIMFRMLDRQTSWDYERGLKTIIPCALTIGILGYPFVLPDMIGGNGPNENSPDYLDNSVYPDPELYIRWIQVNTFLPLVQFSVGPWVYNSSVQATCRQFMQLRQNYTDVIVSLARDATRTGAPIVRPLWWTAPTDEAALTADQQFLLGDDLLVAPVVDKGARSRDVYLPAGAWRDETRGGTHVGPRWLRGYSADLGVLPFFSRV